MKTHINLYLILFSLFATVVVFAQDELISSSKEFSAIQDVDAYQIVHDFQNLSASLFLHSSFVQCVVENKYLLKEFTRQRIDMMMHYQGNLFALQLSHFGYQHYGELGVGLGYGKLLGKKFVLALQFFYWYNHATHYSSIHSLTFNFSASYQINQKLRCGFVIVNPARLKYGLVDKEAPPLPLIIRMDINYKLNKNFLTYLQIEKELTTPLKCKIGGHYQFVKRSALAFGIIIPQPEFYLGIRLTWRNFHCEVRSSYHLKLGLSSSLSLFIPFRI